MDMVNGSGTSEKGFQPGVGSWLMANKEHHISLVWIIRKEKTSWMEGEERVKGVRMESTRIIWLPRVRAGEISGIPRVRRRARLKHEATCKWRQ